MVSESHRAPIRVGRSLHDLAVEVDADLVLFVEVGVTEADDADGVDRQGLSVLGRARTSLGISAVEQLRRRPVGVLANDRDVGVGPRFDLHGGPLQSCEVPLHQNRRLHDYSHFECSGEDHPDRGPEGGVSEIADPADDQSLVGIVTQGRIPPTRGLSATTQSTRKTAVVVHAGGHLDAWLHRNGKLACGKVDFVEPHRFLELLKDRQFECDERIGASVAGRVHAAEKSTLHAAARIDAPSPSNVRNFGEAAELGGEVEVDAGVDLDIRLSDLPAGPGSRYFDFEVGLLRRVHEKIPIPTEVGQLLGHQIQNALAVVHAGSVLIFRGKAPIVLAGALQLLQFFAKTEQFSLLDRLVLGVFGLFGVEVGPVHPKVRAHLREFFVLKGLVGHPLEVEVQRGNCVG
mmetsp:Transcript_92468/g.193315  ORF Transcript_92468/g.193315 Transcript_92468/m.193315 type:complete len:403 (-) Transcript_92468:612-1820(-)